MHITLTDEQIEDVVAADLYKSITRILSFSESNKDFDEDYELVVSMLTTLKYYVSVNEYKKIRFFITNSVEYQNLYLATNKANKMIEPNNPLFSSKEEEDEIMKAALKANEIRYG